MVWIVDFYNKVTGVFNNETLFIETHHLSYLHSDFVVPKTEVR